LRKISDTIARLAALQAQHARHAPGPGGSGRLSALNGFGSNPGALSAKTYLPEGLSRGAPLVVALHGCTQNAPGYDHHSGWSQLADEAGFALLFPEQQRRNNANLCFNWFEPADTRLDSGEALSIRQMIEATVVAHGLDRDRIYVTGLSAGGAMAAVMLATYPEVFAAGAIIAGLPYGTATTIPEAFDRMRGHGGPSEQELQRLVRRVSTYKGPWPRISIWQGTADHTVAPSNAQAIAAQWRGMHKLEKAPTVLETAGRLTRQVWCDAAGERMIEINMIDGMGHGTPVGNDGLGSPGPYMLDVGISSTREIARFWGIAAKGEGAFKSLPSKLADEQPPSRPAASAVIGRKARPSAPGTLHVVADGKSSNASGLQKTIEDALRAAGLMH
jgi:poly(hydroxyalkanoate) depolymerase family esterase